MGSPLSVECVPYHFLMKALSTFVLCALVLLSSSAQAGIAYTLSNGDTVLAE